MTHPGMDLLPTLAWICRPHWHGSAAHTGMESATHTGMDLPAHGGESDRATSLVRREADRTGIQMAVMGQHAKEEDRGEPGSSRGTQKIVVNPEDRVAPRRSW